MIRFRGRKKNAIPKRSRKQKGKQRRREKSMFEKKRERRIGEREVKKCEGERAKRCKVTRVVAKIVTAPQM